MVKVGVWCGVGGPYCPATQDMRGARPHLKSPGPEYLGSGGEEQLQQHQLSRHGAVTSDQQLHREYQDRRRIIFSGGRNVSMGEEFIRS